MSYSEQHQISWDRKYTGKGFSKESMGYICTSMEIHIVFKFGCI